MPVDFYIDVPLGVVFCRGSGAVTYAEMLDFRSRLRRHPDFRPEMRQLFDLRPVLQFNVTTEEIREMARARTFDPSSRRAFLANRDLVFGLSRMIAANRDPASETGFLVCRELGDALSWLSLSEEPDPARFPAPSPEPGPPPVEGP